MRASVTMLDDTDKNAVPSSTMVQQDGTVYANRGMAEARARAQNLFDARANLTTVPKVSTADTTAQVGNVNLARAALAQSAPLHVDPRLRAQQMDAQAMQQQLALGGTPSAAQIQAAQGQQAGLQAQLQALANARGGTNGNLLQQQMAQEALNQSLGIAAGGAQARAQEQTQRQQAAAQSALGLRTQDVGQAAQMAQLQSQAGQFNATQGNQMALQQGSISQQLNQAQAQMANANAQRVLQGNIANQQAAQTVANLNQQRQLQALGLMQGIDTGAQNILQGYDANNAQMTYGQMQNQQAVNNANRDFVSTLAGGAMSAVGTVLPMLLASDERLKEAIDRHSARDDVRDMLDNLDVASYHYKDEAAHGAGRKWGIMAQSLQSSDAGRALVVETPEGLGVDTVRGFGTLMAALKDVHERTKRLERKGGR